jgi:hypothetical protein
MSWLELSWPAQTLRAALVYAWFLSRHIPLAASGAFEGAEGLKLLGWEFLLLIIVTFIAGLVTQIVFVITSVATGQEVTDGIDDERDKHIEARAMVHGFSMTGFGFLGMVLALWQGWGAVWALNIMLAGMVLADIVVNLYKCFRYWRGG